MKERIECIRVVVVRAEGRNQNVDVRCKYPFLHPHTHVMIFVSLHTCMCTHTPTVVTCGTSKQILKWELRLTVYLQIYLSPATAVSSF